MKDKNADIKYSVSILCGGHSSRMGQDKAEMKMQAGGKRMADRLLDTFAGCDEILLSVRDEKQLSDLGVLTDGNPVKARRTILRVTDPVRDAGPLAGIVASLRACREDWLFVTAVDMPYMDRKFAEDLLAASGKQADACLSSADAIVPVRPDGHVQPLSAFYNKSALPVLETCLAGEIRSLWKCLQKIRTVRVPVSLIPDSERKLVNLNRPEDLAESPSPGTSTYMPC